jgi:hypothetical protein
MFSFTRTSPARQRTLDALGLVRSFLLLEDDTAVDWEVGQGEQVEVDHPHRAALRGRVIERRLARRRPGQGTPAAQVCVCPIGSRGRSDKPVERCSVRGTRHLGASR